MPVSHAPKYFPFPLLRDRFHKALAESTESAVFTKVAAPHTDIQTSMRYVYVVDETVKKEVKKPFE
ncbi:hypothetical protein GGP86_000320 [Salinibacter ruber]|uniref:hypothetical protein n=1 Tax=Salinibacter ruber TaxID=146919 RepID=UPI0021690156|nr:hypothetical protein [Salinibacter ruber]MCS3860572.1 hypothetical protein [Salinibacter ruber]